MLRSLHRVSVAVTIFCSHAHNENSKNFDRPKLQKRETLYSALSIVLYERRNYSMCRPHRAPFMPTVRLHGDMCMNIFPYNLTVGERKDAVSPAHPIISRTRSSDELGPCKSMMQQILRNVAPHLHRVDRPQSVLRHHLVVGQHIARDPFSSSFC